MRNRILYLLLPLCFVSAAWAQTTYFAQTTTNLHLAANWNSAADGSGTAPADFTNALDIFEIDDEIGTVTIGANWVVVGNVQVGNGSNAVNLSTNGFTISGTFNVGNTATLSVNTNSTFTIGTLATGSTVSYNGDLAQSVRSGTYDNLTLTNATIARTKTASGAITVNGNLTVDNLNTLAMTTFLLNGTLTSIAGTGVVSTTNTSLLPIPAGKIWTQTVNYAAATSGISDGTYENLTIGTAGTKTAQGNIVVNTTLNLTGTATTILAMSTFTLSGGFTPTGIGTISTTSVSANLPTGKIWTQTVSYPLAGAQDIVDGTYQNLSITGSGTKPAVGNIVVNGILTVTAATLNMLGFDLTGAFTNSGTGTIQTGNVTVTPLPAGKTWTQTVAYSSVSSQTVVDGTYAALNTSGGDRVFSSADSIRITGTFTTGAGALDFTGTSIALRGGTQAITITGQTAITFNNLSVSVTGTKTFSSAAATITVNGVLNIPVSTRILFLGTNKLELGMSATLAGSGSLSTTCVLADPLPSGITWPYTVSYSATASNPVASGTYFNLIISGGGTATANGDITVTNNLTVSGALALSTFRLISVGGTITNSSTISSAYTAGSDAFPSGRTWPGTVSYVAAGNQTIVDGTYTNLSLSGGGSFVKSATANLTVTGTLTTAASTILDLGTFQLLSTTTIANSGTIRTQNTSATPIPAAKTYAGTVEYNGGSNQTIVNAIYTNLNLTGGDRTLSSSDTIKISGTFTMGAGNFISTGSTIALTGTTQSIAGGGQTLNNFALTGGTVKTVSVGGFNVDGELSVPSGRTLAMTTFNLGGTLSSIIGTGTITTTSVSATAIASGKTWTQTVNYAGVAQTIAGGTYQNLTLSGSGTKTASGNINVLGTLNSGALVFDMSTFDLSGITTLTATGTLSTASTSSNPIPLRTWTYATVNYNGAGTQNVVGGQYVALNLTGGDRTLSATDSIKVSGTFTMGAGAFTTTGSVVALNGATTQTIAAGGQVFNNVAIILGTTKTVTVNGFGINGNLHVASGATLAMGAFGMNGLLATTSGTGSVTTTNIGASPLPNGVTWTPSVTYSAATQNVALGIYNNLTISTAGTKTALGNITVNGVLTVSATLAMSTSLLDGTLTSIAGAGTITTQNTSVAPIPAGKTWTQNITYNSTSPQTVVDGTYSLALNVAGGDRTFSNAGNINIGGTFTANTGVAVYTTTGSTLVFTSAAAQTLTLAANFPFENVSFTGGNTKTIGVAISVAGTINIASGVTVNIATFALSGATLTTTGTGVLRTQNTSATPIPSAKTWSFRLQFDGNANQTIPLGIYSGGLYGIGTSGVRTKTLAGAIEVADTLSITTTFATLVLNGHTLLLNGIINPAQTGTITGSATSRIVVGSNTEDAGTLRMTQTTTATRSLNNLTLSRATGADALILGNELQLIGVLTLTDGTLASNGNLVFVSSGVGTSAQIDVVTGTGNVSGNVVVQRYIDGQPIATNVRWRFLASSVNTSNGIDDNWQQQMYITGSGTGGTLCPTLTPNTNGFDPTPENNPSFYTRNAATDAWVALPNTNATELQTGVGYRVFYRGSRSQSCATVFTNTPPTPSDTTLVATGTLAIGLQLIGGGVVANRYALVGNPFQATLDWESVSISLTNLSNTISTLRPNTAGGTYAYYTRGVGGTNGMTQYMSPGTSFWIQTLANGVSALGIGEAAKAVSQGGFAFFKTDQTATNVMRIKLSITNSSDFLDEALVAIRPSSSWSYNSAEEAAKLGFGTNQLQLQIPDEATKMAICVVPSFDATHNRINLDAKTVVGSDYTYNFNGLTEFDASLGITLYDTYTGTSQDLRSNAVYNFTTPDITSTASTRFYILFNANTNPLPVKLTSLVANAISNEDVELNWQTASEQQSDYFIVERSTDGNSYKELGMVDAAGNSRKPRSYSFVDRSIDKTGVLYYRLKQVDFGGKFTYSKVVSVQLGQTVKTLTSADVSLYPVPADNLLMIEVKNPSVLTNPAITFYDMFGKEVTLNTTYESGKWMVQTDELRSGIYLINITNQGETTQLRFVKR